MRLIQPSLSALVVRLGLAVAMIATATTASAVPVINLGTFNLVSGVPHAAFPILVTGDEAQLAGAEIRLAVDAANSPTYSLVVRDASTIFTPTNSFPSFPTANVPPGRVEYQSLTVIDQSADPNNPTTVSTLTPSNILALITFNTSNLTPGTYPITLSASPLFSTVLLDSNGNTIPTTYIAGQIVVTAVPEPSTIVLLVMCAATAAALAFSRRGPKLVPIHVKR